MNILCIFKRYIYIILKSYFALASTVLRLFQLKTGKFLREHRVNKRELGFQDSVSFLHNSSSRTIILCLFMHIVGSYLLVYVLCWFGGHSWWGSELLPSSVLCENKVLGIELEPSSMLSGHCAVFPATYLTFLILLEVKVSLRVMLLEESLVQPSQFA